MLGELVAVPALKPQAIDKLRYSHEAMIDLIVGNPWISQNEIAARFGYTPGWVCQVFASDAFQAKLAQRRDEIVDPALKATIKERFQALVLRSLEVLQEKLSKPQISDNVAIRAAELGAKALGLGGHAAPEAPRPAVDRLNELAGRLIELQSGIRSGVVINGHSEVIPDPQEVL
jgi:hypothetical protein